MVLERFTALTCRFPLFPLESYFGNQPILFNIGTALHLTVLQDRFQRSRSQRNSESVMAQVCGICGKGPQFGNNISHAHNVSRRRWNVNLRPVKAKTETGNKKIRVCTSCIRSGKVVKAVKTSVARAAAKAKA